MQSFFASILLLKLYYPTIVQTLPSTTSANAQRAVFDILNNPDYNKDFRPLPPSGNATEIRVNLAVRKLNQIDDLKMAFTAQLSFRQQWEDHRLKYEVNGTEGVKYVTLNEALGEKIWTPDLFFMNEASAFVHTNMKPNTFKRVFPSGLVIWSTRITATFSCPMDLKFFPFDKVICSIEISSYSGTKKDLNILWEDKDPVQLLIHPHLPQFRLLKYETGGCFSEVAMGSFDCIMVDLHFQRKTGFYISQIYCPSAAYTMISWISLWLGPSISARLSLSVTVLLTMATQVQGTNQNLPQVSYIRAIDQWTGVCLSFCVLSILQTATVAYLLQNSQYDKNYGTGNIIGSWDQKTKTAVTAPKYNPLAIKLDKVSRILFPLCYLLFVLVYVLTYVISENPVTRERIHSN